MRNAIMITASLLIILLGLYGSSVLLLNEDRLKSLLAEHIERDSGRRIEIRGDLRIRLFPGLRLEAEDIEISGPRSYDGPALLEAEYLAMNLRLLPMIRGEVQASQVRLRGASLNLHSDPGGVSSLDGLLGAEGGEEGGQGWIDGPVQVDEVLVNLSDSLGNPAEQFSVDQIELDGFAVGEPVQFRFQGNVGEPPLFDGLEVDALMLPQSGGRFRLANMRLVGSMEQGHFDVEILGNLDVQPGPPLSVSLDAGQLRINEHQFTSAIDYTAFDRPYFNVRLASELIDLDVASIPALLGAQLGPEGDSSVIAGLQGMDFDLEAEIDQVARAGLILKDFEMAAQSRDRRLTVDRLTAEVPGGFMSALGVVTMNEAGWSSELGLRIDGDDFRRLGESIPTALMPGGSGALSLALVIDQSLGQTSVSGQGAVELWNGEWSLVENLIPGIWRDAGSDRYDFLSTPIVINEGRVELPEFQLVSERLVLQGQLGLDWPPGPMSGSLDVTRSFDYLQVEVSGSLAAPELEWSFPPAGTDP
jgi:hypothetical protein